MLDKLTVTTFEEQLGKLFRLSLPDGGAIELVLVEARSLSLRPGTAGPRREPFSLLFRGPKSPVLAQRIYPLEHETLGRLEIFLVPVGPDGEGMRYEAIFN